MSVYQGKQERRADTRQQKQPDKSLVNCRSLINAAAFQFAAKAVSAKAWLGEKGVFTCSTITW